MVPTSVHSRYGDALFSDLYELTMGESYFQGQMRAPATFSLFARHLPRDWGYFVAAGLESVLTYLESVVFTKTISIILKAQAVLHRDSWPTLPISALRGACARCRRAPCFSPRNPCWR
jgi:nicotinate phosphoribosyltransferase